MQGPTHPLPSTAIHPIPSNPIHSTPLDSHPPQPVQSWIRLHLKPGTSLALSSYDTASICARKAGPWPILLLASRTATNMALFPATETDSNWIPSSSYHPSHSYVAVNYSNERLISRRLIPTLHKSRFPHPKSQPQAQVFGISSSEFDLV